ncbi:MAG: hypothetical protein CBC09_08405 [Cellvibrionales bacterium TMED49]|jgi:hypothetical protein|nr:MAG: hypothetical protein CBC09_08405 [Cellvibrionales bacterium TMED49]|tara:strand:- start:982 stop:1212 length:231 start_codon:yes stop_codon:yes gene_type:complete
MTNLTPKDCDILIELLYSQVIGLCDEEIDEIVEQKYFDITSKEEADNLYLKLLDLRNDLTRNYIVSQVAKEDKVES